MANSYTWTIDAVYTIPTESVDLFIVDVRFTIQGSDGINSADIKGFHKFNFNKLKIYDEFKSLNEQTIIQWISDSLGEQGISSFTNSIDGQLSALLTPTIVPTLQTLPWSS